MISIRCLFLLIFVAQKFCIADEQFDFWMNVGQNILRKQLNVDFGQKAQVNKNLIRKAKNVILVISPGLSLTTIRAAEWYQKQKYDVGLYYDEFPIVGFVNAVCTREPIVDNECVGSSFLAKNERTSSEDVMESVAKWALDSGKDVGIVTNVRLTSPSINPMFGSKSGIEWESDVDVPESMSNDRFCNDVACQLLLKDPGKKFKVILGGGMKNFVPNTSKMFNGTHGRRSDGRNIINEWIDDKKKRNIKYKFAENRDELLQKDKVKYLLGIFDSDDLEFHLKNDHKEQPTLTEMVRTAITLLSRNDKGYFLFVYDGSIDAAHRNNKARLAFDQTVQLSSALQTIDYSTNSEDTLIVVTADHGSTMTMSGYPAIKDDVMKTAVKKENANYSVITYGNGPGYRLMTDGSDIVEDLDFKYISVAPLDKGTVGGESVPVYARGPWQELFTGIFNLDFIPHAIGYAACIGPGKNSCTSSLKSSANSLVTSYWVYIMTFINIILLKKYHC